MKLNRLLVRGYRSIDELDLPLGQMTVLIGPNGAGKSNIISLFELIHQISEKKFQYSVLKAGGANTILHHGSKVTKIAGAHLLFGRKGYLCAWESTQDDRLIFIQERINILGADEQSPLADIFLTNEHPDAHIETQIFDDFFDENLRNSVLSVLNGIHIYHFHDTSKTSQVRLPGSLHENRYLMPDGGNLAAYLYLLEKTAPKHLDYITYTIRLVAPFFSSFALRPDPLNPELIRIEWNEKDSDYTFAAHQLPDGLLRFMCLATLLLQPKEMMPPFILIDEPELGLHPFAITLLSEMLKGASINSQILITTQSVMLLDQVDLSDIRIVDRTSGSTKIVVPNEEELKEWLEDYSVGELWQKNLLGGLPIQGPQ